MSITKKIILSLFLLINFVHIANAQVSVITPDSLKKGALTLKPGEARDIDILFHNLYSQEVEVRIYALDGLQSSAGNFTAKKIQDEQQFIGKWAHFKTENFNIKAKESISVPLHFEIPDDAIPGDYPGGIGIVKILKKETEAEGEESANVGAALKIQTRTVITFFANIAGEKKAGITFGEAKINKAAQRNYYELLIDAHNTGNTAVKIQIEPSIKALFGAENDLEKKDTLLFPNEHIQIPISIPNLSFFGIYDLKADITSSEVNIIENSETYLEKTTQTKQLVIIPWFEIALTIVIIFVIALLIILRKKHLKKLLINSKKYKVKEGDTITNLAIKNNVSWKLIIKINKLKAPYELIPGQEILIPKKG